MTNKSQSIETSVKSPATKATLFSFAAALGLLFTPGLASAEMSGKDIAAKAYCAMYYQGADVKGRAHMEIYDKKNRKRVRELSLLRRNVGDTSKGECGNQMYYTYFHKPADVKEMSFLVWKNTRKGDDRWLYMPALDLVKRISSADKRTSFFGSHFYYEDVSGRNLSDDTHKLVKETDVYYVIESTPKNKKSVEFARYKVWVAKKNFIPSQVKYYNKKGENYRTLKIEAVKKIGGYDTITRMRMEDKRIGGHTIIRAKGTKYGNNLGKEHFSERTLRKPPKSHL